jgi:hypothetical protein
MWKRIKKGHEMIRGTIRDAKREEERGIRKGYSFWRYWVCTQGLVLMRQVHLHLSHAPSTFSLKSFYKEKTFLKNFSGRVSFFLLEPTFDYDPLIHASHIPGIIDRCVSPHPICMLREGLANFLPRLALN